MENIGRRIYYDLATGGIILDKGETMNGVNTTIEQDIDTFKVLNERVRETYDYIELEYGQYNQDFMESNGRRVNLETKTLEFSYPDPTEPETPQPFQPPLSSEVDKLKKRQDATENAVLELLLGGM